MAGLNLLPWREQARERRKKQFYASLALTAILAGALVFLANTYVNNAVDNQNKRNAYLNEQIAVLDSKITKIKELDLTRSALLERMGVIENLQGTRPAIVHLFDEMATALPNGMYLTALKQEGALIHLEGKAESNARVSSYMNRLDASAWLSSSNLNIISVEKDPNSKQSDNDNRLRDFKLDVQQKLREGDAS